MVVCDSGDRHFRGIVVESSGFFLHFNLTHAFALRVERDRYDDLQKCLALRVDPGCCSRGIDCVWFRNSFNVVGTQSELGASHDFRQSQSVVTGQP